MFMGGILWGILLTIFMKGFDDQEDENNELEVDGDGEEPKEEPAEAPVAEPAAHFFFTPQKTLVLTFPARLPGPARSIMDSGAKPPANPDVVNHRCEVSISNVKVTGVDAEDNPLVSPVAEGLPARAAALVDSDHWGWLSLLFTFWCCLNLGLNEPWLQTCDPTSGSTCATRRAYLVAADAIVVAFLLVEIGLGFLARPAAFFTSRWNQLDVAIVVTSVASLSLGEVTSVPGTNLRAIRAFRAFKALRVFRIVRHLTALEGMLHTMAGIIPAASSAFVIVCIFLYIFAVIGLQSFMGRLNVCNDPYASDGVVGAEQCRGTFTLRGPTCAYLPTPELEAQCRESPNGHPGFPRIYEAQMPNFDNIWNSLLTVFQLSDGENWPTLMYKIYFIFIFTSSLSLSLFLYF